MICPNCNSGMQERSQQGVTVDWCATCTSIWFDTSELEAFRRTSASGQPAADEHEASFNRSPGEQTINCPSCQELSLEYGFYDGVVAASCSRCNGSFFEKEALDAMLRPRLEPETPDMDPLSKDEKCMLGNALLDLLGCLIG